MGFGAIWYKGGGYNLWPDFEFLDHKLVWLQIMGWRLVIKKNYGWAFWRGGWELNAGAIWDHSITPQPPN